MNTLKLIRSVSIVSLLTLFSRLLGFARDMVFANFLGATLVFDAFLVAFKIPNLTRRLFAEGAFSQAFVPVLSELKKKEPHEVIQQFISAIMGSLLLWLSLFSIVAILAAPLLVGIFAPGFIHEAAKFGLTTELLRITTPYLVFIAWVSMASGIQNTYEHFAMPAFSPVLLNVFLISAVFLSGWFRWPIAQTLAMTVLFAGLLQCLVQMPVLGRLQLLPKPRLQQGHPAVKKVWKLMGPALLGGGVAQLSLLIDTIFASFLVTGSLSWLYYSDRLTYFPLGIFGVALATVVLPHLSGQHAEKDPKGFSHSLDWALKVVLVLAVPAAMGLVVLAKPILLTLFKHGRFQMYDVLMAAKSLSAYALGLPAFMLVKVLSSGFYARQDTQSPVRFAVFALTCNIILNFALVHSLAHAGLALATAISATINALLLTRGLIKQKVYQGHGWSLFSLKLLLANVWVGFVLWFFNQDIMVWSSWSVGYRGGYLLFEIVLAAAGYVLALWLLQIKRIKK